MARRGLSLVFRLELRDALQRLLPECGRLASDGRLALAFNLRDAVIQRGHQLTQVSKRTRSVGRGLFRGHGLSPGERLAGGTRYLSRTRVPLIFWLLSSPRKSGTMRSISSKYDERAGVVCCEL